MYGRLKVDVRDIISILYNYKNVEIIAGAVCLDQEYLSVAIPEISTLDLWDTKKEKHINGYMIDIPRYKVSRIKHSGQEAIM